MLIIKSFMSKDLNHLIGRIERISLKEPAPRKPSINLKEMLKNVKNDALERQMGSLNIKKKSGKRYLYIDFFLN